MTEPKTVRVDLRLPADALAALCRVHGKTGRGANGRAVIASINATLIAAGYPILVVAEPALGPKERVAGTPIARERAEKSWAARRARRAELESFAPPNVRKSGKKAKTASVTV